MAEERTPAEVDAARTTIVGGRPPAIGRPVRDVPRGVEVLVKKAAVDPEFKKMLFEQRAEAAEAIGLKLTAAEQAMLAAVPLPQLEGIVAHTRVAPKSRPLFLGYAAGVMLAALGAVTAACDDPVSPPATLGSQPDPPPKTLPWLTDDSEGAAKHAVGDDSECGQHADAVKPVSATEHLKKETAPK